MSNSLETLVINDTGFIPERDIFRMHAHREKTSRQIIL